MTKHQRHSDFKRFFRSWLANPLRVAAVAPSSDALARVMTREILAQSGPVLELGPGTGVFTRALVAQGVAESDITMIEAGGEFIEMLETRFPGARILRMNAAHLGHEALFDEGSVAAVISGLPLLSMPRPDVAAILAGAFTYLQPGGAFYQFTYGPRCPVPDHLMNGLDLTSQRIGGAMLNLPPASVYRITRRSEAFAGAGAAIGLGAIAAASRAAAE